MCAYFFSFDFPELAHLEVSFFLRSFSHLLSFTSDDLKRPLVSWEINLAVSLLLAFVESHLFRKRKWQATPAFLPGESCGWRSLVGCCP